MLVVTGLGPFCGQQGMNELWQPALPMHHCLPCTPCHSRAPCFPTPTPLHAADKTVRLWSLADGSCLRTFEGHMASVLRLDFLSAGTQILSAGADGLIKLWSVRLSGG